MIIYAIRTDLVAGTQTKSVINQTITSLKVLDHANGAKIVLAHIPGPMYSVIDHASR